MAHGAKDGALLLETEQGVEVNPGPDEHELRGDRRVGHGVVRPEHSTHRACADLLLQLQSSSERTDQAVQEPGGSLGPAVGERHEVFSGRLSQRLGQEGRGLVVREAPHCYQIEQPVVAQMDDGPRQRGMLLIDMGIAEGSREQDAEAECPPNKLLKKANGRRVGEVKVVHQDRQRRSARGQHEEPGHLGENLGRPIGSTLVGAVNESSDRSYPAFDLRPVRGCDGLSEGDEGRLEKRMGQSVVASPHRSLRRR